MTCSGCSRSFRQDGYQRCRKCRESAKVTEHQRRQRGFRRHSCLLCRKHKRLVKELNRRWDERDVYVRKRCPEGHCWYKYRANQRCTTCQCELNKKIMREMKRREREKRRAGHHV